MKLRELVERIESFAPICIKQRFSEQTLYAGMGFDINWEYFEEYNVALIKSRNDTIYIYV